MKIAQKDTGNYVLKLFKDPYTVDGYYDLEIIYVGEWASGDTIVIELVTEKTPTQIKKWFKHTFKGDLDAIEILDKSGHDKYTNLRRPLIAVHI
jgi:hypothetical protein